MMQLRNSSANNNNNVINAKSKLGLRRPFKNRRSTIDTTDDALRSSSSYYYDPKTHAVYECYQRRVVASHDNNGNDNNDKDESSPEILTTKIIHHPTTIHINISRASKTPVRNDITDVPKRPVFHRRASLELDSCPKVHRPPPRSPPSPTHSRLTRSMRIDNFDRKDVASSRRLGFDDITTASNNENHHERMEHEILHHSDPTSCSFKMYEENEFQGSDSRHPSNSQIMHQSQVHRHPHRNPLWNEFRHKNIESESIAPRQFESFLTSSYYRNLRDSEASIAAQAGYYIDNSLTRACDGITPPIPPVLFLIDECISDKTLDENARQEDNKKSDDTRNQEAIVVASSSPLKQEVVVDIEPKSKEMLVPEAAVRHDQHHHQRGGFMASIKNKMMHPRTMNTRKSTLQDASFVEIPLGTTQFHRLPCPSAKNVSNDNVEIEKKSSPVVVRSGQQQQQQPHHQQRKMISMEGMIVKKNLRQGRNRRPSVQNVNPFAFF